MALAGKRILIVEDEPVIAMTVADMLEMLGAVPVGPVGSVRAALALIDAAPIDAALLDVNLGGERSDPIAERLRAAATPYLFATGYGSGPEGDDVVRKPFTQAHLAAAFARLFG